MRAISPVLLLAGLSVFSGGCATQCPEAPSIAVRESVEAAMMEPTVPITSDRQIPAVIRKRFARVAGEDFHVAPPGSTAFKTHAVRALVFAARSKHYFTICYEVISRSMADGSRVLIASTKPGENDGYGYLIYVAQCRADCRNMSDLRKAFAEGKLNSYRPTFIDF